tara:strand:+ start:1029 stop:1718 length:690 start_codon:yes stop_codon:yes gene_type:complete
MKIILRLTLCLVTCSALITTSCSKDGEVGPAGSQGPQGEQGIQGIEGEQGIKGDTGNANVKHYDFVIANTDWSTNLHFGGGNEGRYYNIPADSLGGISLYSFYDKGNAVLAYAMPTYAAGSDRETVPNTIKPLPYSTMVSSSTDQFGLLIDILVNESRLFLAKTINGYEPDRIPDEDMPATIDFRIVLIESSNALTGKSSKENILDDLKASGVDVRNYSEVMDHFNLPY